MLLAQCSMPRRRADKVDANQGEIVDALRRIPGLSVETGKDDILIGYKGRTYWYEIKTPDTVSPRTGQVRPSEITDAERKLLETWPGHYRIVWTVEQILDEVLR